MGGGDLNSKKSWHPNTMKNQERVWKAEQAAAEEKKRIMELQHERAAERDRAELNDLAKRSAGDAANDDRLHWMYDKPDKKGPAEDYLLGKTIDKNYDQSEKSDDIIPAVARRVVGSSMMTTAEDSQVDLVRKMREDPLLLVKERERAARAALLNNPLHRKRIADLLRKEQEQKGKEKKTKKKDKDLDNMLAAKLNALGGEKGIDVAALLASDNSSSSSESSDDDEKKKKKKKSDKKLKKSKKSKKKKKHSQTESSDDDDKIQQKVKHNKLIKSSEKQKFKQDDKKQSFLHKKEIRKYRNESSDSERNIKNRGSKRKGSEERRYNSDYQRLKNKQGESYRSDEDNKSRQHVKQKEHNRDAFENKQYESYWAQGRKRSISQESDRECRNKRNRDSSVERKQADYQRQSRKRRSESYEYKNKRSKGDSSKEKRKQRSVSQDSGRDAKTKRSRKDSSDYRNDKRKQRSVSEDSNDRAQYRSNEREMYSGNKKLSYKEFSPMRPGSSRDAFESKTSQEQSDRKIKVGLSVEEKAARLAEMAAAGVQREQQRGRRVADQRAADARAAAAPPAPRRAAPPLPRSLESRLHSNRHYIQRNPAHMNEHFARR